MPSAVASSSSASVATGRSTSSSAASSSARRRSFSPSCRVWSSTGRSGSSLANGALRGPQHHGTRPTRHGVGVTHHLRQLDEVDTRRFREPLCLPDSDECGELDEVPRELRPRSRADWAEMSDQSGPTGEHGTALLQRIRRASNHDGQVALVGTHETAADRGIDDVDPGCGRLRGEHLGGPGSDRRVDGDDAARPSTGEDSIGAVNDGANLVVVEHHHRDHVGHLGDLGRRRRPHVPLARRTAPWPRRATSHTTRPSGQSTRWLAIGAPMLPRPMKPTALNCGTPGRRRR